VKFDPATSSWKTHRCLFDEDLPESSVILPRWGMTQDGVCWERTTSEPPTSATESGSWQTPTVEDAGRNGSKKDWLKYEEKGQTSGCRLRNQVKMWPTPCASEARQGYQNRNNGKKGSQESLSTVVQGGPAHEVGGALSPTWVDWLMGWPIEWTAFDALATGKFQQWSASHGICSPKHRNTETPV
jgi:hypothetical protein